LKDHRDATMLQTTISSTVGSTASIVVACPLDVVKTRVQSGHFQGVSGLQIIRDIAKSEGYGGFFKGIVPKVGTVGPKLVFSFAVAQYVMAFLERRI